MSAILLTLFVRRAKVFNVDFNDLREIIKKNLVRMKIVRTFALPFEGETVQSSDNLKGNNCGLEQTVSSSDS